MAARKYSFKDKAEAQTRIQELEMERTLHHITLTCILNEEYTFTRRFTAGGSWFEIGLARASSAHGGLLLVREYYPANKRASQRAEWADGWFRQMGEWYATYNPIDAEAVAFRDCVMAARELYRKATQAAA